MSRPIRRSRLFVETLEDRRVMSTFGFLDHLVNHDGNLPPGLMKNESHLLAVHHLLSGLLPAQDAAPTAGNGQVTVAVMDIIIRVDATTTVKLDDVVVVRVEPAKSETNVRKVSVVAEPAPAASVAPVPVRPFVGPVQTTVKPVAESERVEKVGTGRGTDEQAPAEARPAGQVGMVPPPVGQTGWMPAATPEVMAAHALPIQAPMTEEAARLVGASGWIGRSATSETEEARAERAATVTGTELRWTPSSTAETRTEPADAVLLEVPFPATAHLSAGPMATSDTTLGLAIQQFLDQLDEIGQELSRSLAERPWAVWLVAGALSAAAVELTRRRLRRRTRLALAGADDPSLSWVPGLPGPFSTEEA